MLTKRAIGLGFLGAALLASTSYCTSKVQKPVGVVMNTVPVALDSACTATPETVTIRVQDQVSWTANDQAYSVVFSNSPFTNIQSGTALPVPKSQTVVSGAVTPSAQQACSGPTPCPPYKYTVNGNGCTNDPHVIIKP
jgi:Tfp pilus assembly protein PilX